MTVDVEALYPSLIISDCKKHCTDAYLRYNENNTSESISLDKKGILDLLGLSLDYNYVAYNNQMYFQHKGIEKYFEV